MTDMPNSAGPQKPGRRWFQFRLRTLLMAVALLSLPCWWLGWQVKIVRERNAVRARFEKIDVAFLRDNNRASSLWWSFRRLLGDEPVLIWSEPPPLSQAQVDEIKAAFPESHELAELLCPQSSGNESSWGGSPAYGSVAR